SFSHFPFLVSTHLYPEWAFAALPYVNKKTVRELAVALLEIEPDSPVAKAADIYGFTAPGDYLPVENLARALRLPPFEKAPAFTPKDAWARWSLQLSAGAIAIGIILALSILLLLANRRIKQQEKAGRMHLAALGEGVFGITLEGQCTFINPAALSMLGYAEHEIIGQNPHALFHHHHPDGEIYPAEDCPVIQTVKDGVVRHVDDWFTNKDGRTFPVSVVATPLENRGVQVGAVIAFQDISERKNLEEKLNALATTDVLTGLPNRRHFFSRMSEELARMRRLDVYVASLLMLDLDHFKRINDSYGHATGDAALKHFAALMQKDLRETDLVGRLGGEEFAILMPGASLDDAVARAERLRKLIESDHFHHEGMDIQYTVSIGLTQLTRHDTDPDVPLARADNALFRAKEKRNCVAT
ncbi:MAG: sensor domain-containing diguanylate cyclase, partial [Gammaproteobacteria bacterium]|nr:sensor domain-containing diguanylate cyclase [Gammaproteobacteria bacterium]